MSARDSKPDRTPEKGAYQAPAPSTSRPLRDRDSTSVRRTMNELAADPKLVARAQTVVTAAVCGDPPPGRSALDQKRANG